LFSGSCWIGGIVSIDSSSNWNVYLTIDLTVRDSSGKINSSPVTTLDCYVEIGSGCSGAQILQIPVSDPDGDVVKCFCTNNTCLSIMSIDSDTCVITFQKTSGTYAIYITIQDFNSGSSVPKSSIELQFVTYINPTSTNCCK
jgi:hypothetical protein